MLQTSHKAKKIMSNWGCLHGRETIYSQWMAIQHQEDLDPLCVILEQDVSQNQNEEEGGQQVPQSGCESAQYPPSDLSNI